MNSPFYPSLLKLPPELIPFTVQAVKCQLSGIHCPAADAAGDDNVCHKATKAMMDLLTSQPLVAIVKVNMFSILGDIFLCIGYYNSIVVCLHEEGI